MTGEIQPGEESKGKEHASPEHEVNHAQQQQQPAAAAHGHHNAHHGQVTIGSDSEDDAAEEVSWGDPS